MEPPTVKKQLVLEQVKKGNLLKYQRQQGFVF
jgi:hypothetical protein